MSSLLANILETAYKDFKHLNFDHLFLMFISMLPCILQDQCSNPWAMEPTAAMHFNSIFVFNTQESITLLFRQ